MRLRTNIFLWVALASVVPLTALALGAVAYSELQYRRGIAREVAVALSAMAAEIDRRLQFERELFRALARSPALREFHPVLEWAARGDIHPEFFEREDRVNGFLEALQAVVPGMRSLRVLDLEGNALIRVRFGRRTEPIFDGYEGFPFAEEATDPEALAARLARLPPGEVSFLRLPTSVAAARAGVRVAMLDAVVPLVADGRVLGYLAVSPTGEAVDRILDLVPRPYGGELTVAELDPDDPGTARILYADATGARFTAAAGPAALGEAFPWGAALARAARESSYGIVRGRDGSSVHFLEYLPYPDQLVSWLIAYRVPAGAVAAPFAPIRLAVPLFAAVALLLALLIGRLGARQVAGPVAELARGLARYARGERGLRLRAPRGADEIRSLVGAFNEMAETLEHAQAERDRARARAEAQARLASLGRLAAGIGHEINNPLSNILSLVRLAERGLERGQDPRADLAAIREEALRASRIVQGVLDFARQAPPRRAPFAARPWIEETVRLVAAQARKRGVRIEAEPLAEATVHGDRGQLQQALLNLLLNAVQASPAGATVTVTAARERDRDGRTWLAVRVRDRGPGLPPEAEGRLFEPFFTTKPVGEGTGLGLAIAHGIVARHAGSLAVENHPGGGAEARLVLPLEPAPAEEEEAHGG